MNTKKLQYGAARYGPEGVYELDKDPVVFRSARARSTVLFLLYALVLLFLGTELLAFRLNFDPALGKPEFGKIYDPWMVIVWAYKLSNLHFRSAAYAAFIFQSLTGVAVLMLVGGVAAYMLAHKQYLRFIETAPRPPDLRGSAHWATPAEIKAMGLLPND